jgi:uncharacterized membrane protein
MHSDALIQEPVAVTAVLLVVLAILFSVERHPKLGRLFRVVPLIVFAYFVPTVLSNTGLIPLASPAYEFIKSWLLPASLILLTMSIDLPAILRLGKYALVLFLAGTASIVLGGPIAYLALGWLVPADLGEQAWKGLAALSGSWIGGGANFVAIGASVGADASILSMMVVVDVAVANIWTAVLLFFAGRERQMDAKIGADRSRIDEVRAKVESFQRKVARPTSLPDLLLISAIAIGGTVAATQIATALPDVGDIIKGFTWVVILVTTLGIVISFTSLRNLEGAGASRVGSLFLYLLIASIGAHAEFRRVVETPGLMVVGALWISIHAGVLLLVRRWLRAPIFFMAVGSQANVGGAASAPVVASAFHPALAPVGVLLAVAGYVLGTYAALLCAFLLQQVHGVIG